MSRRREMTLLRKEAESGDLRAAVELADMLEDDGDLASAKHWHQYAAERGDIAGALGIGILLADEGALEEAERWLRTAVAAKHPDDKRFAEIAAAGLGRVLLESNRVDEAEPWIKVAIAAGIEQSKQDLEALQIIRSGRGQGRGPQRTSSEILQEFEVHGIIFYDGSGHRLGPSVCTLTRTRFTIEDARGGISQIQLRDISSVNTPAPIISPKQLRIKAPGVAYDIYCHSKDQKNLLEAWLMEAIRGA